MKHWAIAVVGIAVGVREVGNRLANLAEKGMGPTKWSDTKYFRLVTHKVESTRQFTAYGVFVPPPPIETSPNQLAGCACALALKRVCKIKV